jgi:hypothetical protein
MCQGQFWSSPTNQRVQADVAKEGLKYVKWQPLIVFVWLAEFILYMGLFFSEQNWTGGWFCDQEF